MFAGRTIDISQRLDDREVRLATEALAGALPRLMADARRASATIVAGLHGRRRSGPGESFWQFRPFMSGEGAQRVDWRRSARDDQLYVREREWEAAQAIHLFMDRSPSMDYRSRDAKMTKGERGIVLGLALADALVRGGERVGLSGVLPPTASRRIIDRLADAMITAPQFGKVMPAEPLPPRAEAVLISDFIAPLEALGARLRSIASRGARGHLVLIRDPAEETFPFAGQTEFIDPEDGARLRVGEARAMHRTYAARLEAHRSGLAEIAKGLGWTFTRHVTDKPASDVLLALGATINQGGTAR